MSERRYSIDRDGHFHPSHDGGWRKDNSGYPIPTEERTNGLIGALQGAAESIREEEKKAMQRKDDFRQGRVDVARKVQEIINDATKSDREKLEQISRITEALKKSFGESINE